MRGEGDARRRAGRRSAAGGAALGGVACDFDPLNQNARSVQEVARERAR